MLKNQHCYKFWDAKINSTQKEMIEENFGLTNIVKMIHKRKHWRFFTITKHGFYISSIAIKLQLNWL